MSGLVDRLLGRKQEKRSWSVFRDAWIKAQGAEATAGESVTEQTALGVAAVYACVKVLSESMASLPVHLYRKNPDGGRERVVDHPVVRLLEVAPNPEMTSYELRELRMAHLSLRGNAYHRIARSGGRPVEMWPLHPDYMEIRRRGKDLIYRYSPPTGDVKEYPMRDILHFKGLGSNGLIGYSPLELARETFGHYIAAQKFGARLFANSARPSGLLRHPSQLDKETADRIAASWTRNYGGANSNGVAVLEEGMEFQPLSINPDDAQFLETLKDKRTDVCGIFRVPPHMIADLDKATFSNIEKQDLFFAKHTLVPNCERQEQVMNMRLLTEDEQGTLYIEHNLAGVMRGDIKTRVEAMTMLWDRGIVNADEIREMENWNPQNDDLGKTYYVPMNFMPAGSDPPPALPAGDPPTRHDCSQHEQRGETRGGSRQTIQNSFVLVLEDAMRRVVRRDIQNIRAAVKKNLRSEGSFIEWLEEYYRDTDYAQNQITPAITALAEALGPELMREAGGDWDFNAGLRAWVDSYIATFAEHYAEGAQRDISRLLTDADVAEAAELIHARMDVWEDGDASGSRPRATQIAAHESVRFGGAFAVAVFAGAGILALRWSTVGKNCPFCDQLEGQVVGIEEPFVDAGRSVVAGDGTEVRPSRPILHPPLHDGCDCIVTPG